MKPGLDHLNLFQNVKEIVLATTGGVRHPWEAMALLAEFISIASRK
jgi:hypothetical protein